MLFAPSTPDTEWCSHNCSWATWVYHLHWHQSTFCILFNMSLNRFLWFFVCLIHHPPFLPSNLHAVCSLPVSNKHYLEVEDGSLNSGDSTFSSVVAIQCCIVVCVSAKSKTTSCIPVNIFPLVLFLLESLDVKHLRSKKKKKKRSLAIISF